MEITNDIKYVGVNDHEIDLFEGQYIVENGMAYNSYVITDDKIAVMDSVDARFGEEWLTNIKNTLNGAASFRQYRKLHGSLQRDNHCFERKIICHDETIFWHRLCRQAGCSKRW